MLLALFILLNRYDTAQLKKMSRIDGAQLKRR